jgi:polyferredoxin
MLFIDLMGSTAVLFALAAIVGSPTVGALCLVNALIVWRFGRRMAK